MAAPVIGGKRRGRYRPLAEINVTPLVDVMLVLLIIFMVTAPLMTSGVNIDLPKASAQPVSQDSEPLTVSLTADGRIFLQDTELPMPELASKLAAIAEGKMDRRIFVRGDKSLAYGKIMEVMGTITEGGFTKVALLAEQTGTAANPSVRAPTVPTGVAPTGAVPAAAVPAPRRGRG